jgi:hypothetical protein
MRFYVHTKNLLNEMMITPHNSVCQKPVNILVGLLAEVAQRAIELNDEKLNKLMVLLTLYEQSDPNSKDYDSKLHEWAMTP